MTARALIVLLCLVGLALIPACAQTDLAPAQSRLGINLNGPADWNSEIPFVDVFRLSREWISQRQGEGWGKGPQLQRDANGWITQLEPNCWADTPMCTIRGGHFPKGRYTCLYEGEGEIEFWGDSSVVEKTPGKLTVEVKPTAEVIWLRLRSVNPANYVRNIRMIMPGCEGTCQQEPYRAGFLAQWKSMNTIRFMDWMLTNHDFPGTWATRPTPTYCNFTERGVPVEVMVDLCNRLKVNPWFCMPARADDDYVRQFASYVHDHLDPSLKAYLEYSNEVWNSIFPACKYAQQKGQELGLGPKERPWEGGGMYYTRRSLEIFKLWQEVFEGRSRLVRVLCWQAVNPWWMEHIILPTDEAFSHADATGIAPYFGPLIPPTTGNDGRPGADQIVNWTVEQLLDYIEQKTLPEAIEAIKQQKVVADRFGLKLVAYEAGQHLVGLGAAQNNEKLTALLMQANRHPRMGAIYTKYLDAWKAAGGDLMCIFSSVSSWGKYGSWGLTEWFDETENDQAKLKAVMDWMRNNPR